MISWNQASLLFFDILEYVEDKTQSALALAEEERESRWLTDHLSHPAFLPSQLDSSKSNEPGRTRRESAHEAT
jgi:hypothetical protein